MYDLNDVPESRRINFGRINEVAVALLPSLLKRWLPEGRIEGHENPVPVDLHQRLSEFSYGYGVTREAERLLRSIGLETVPFLPSLVHEAKLGYDVKFGRPGLPLLLQFKLGEALQRFRKTNDMTKPAPPLGKPFWRFWVDTLEPDGQFDRLRKAEPAAEVYYVAPRFTTWGDYAIAFQAERVLDDSLLIAPSEVDEKLASQSEPDGWHRFVYDRSSVFVCSGPVTLEEQNPSTFAQTVRSKIEHRMQRIDDGLREVRLSFDRSREVRVRPSEDADRRIFALATPPPGELSQSPELAAQGRSRRLADLRTKAVTEADALFAFVGLEFWAVGAQLIAVTLGNGL